MSIWQPIETAPKDGTEIIAVCGPHIEFVTWGGPYPPAIVVGDWYDRSGERVFTRAPTYWMPLPEPPINAALAEKNSK